MPSYVEEIDAARGLWDNVRDGVLRPAARLADEPTWLRFTDLRSDIVYSSILRAIALGNRRPGKIATAIEKSRADEIMHHLDRLSDLRLVQRVVPVHEQGGGRSRHSLYLLADHYVAFWYRHVDRLRHLLGMRRYDDALARIRADFDRCVSGHPFEDLCRQFLWIALAGDRLPTGLTFDHVGSWWVAREEEKDEIDVVAMAEGHATLVGECKWSAQPVGLRELEGLRAALWKATPDLSPVDRPWRALFSRSGFTQELASLAADPEERILLVEPGDPYR